MFERFTHGAREVVVLAQQDAHARWHDYVGTEHLLMGLFGVADSVAADVLGALGVRRQDVDADIVRIVGPGREAPDRQADALASIGIDLDEVRRQVEAAFGPGALELRRYRRRRGWERSRTACGPGHLRFAPRSKKALELSLRHALALKDNYIGTEHILLGLLATSDGLACHLLDARGVNLEVARAAIIGRERGAAGA